MKRKQNQFFHYADFLGSRNDDDHHKAVARVKMDQWLYTQVNGRRVAHAESVKIAAES